MVVKCQRLFTVVNSYDEKTRNIHGAGLHNLRFVDDIALFPNDEQKLTDVLE